MTDQRTDNTVDVSTDGAGVVVLETVGRKWAVTPDLAIALRKLNGQTFGSSVIRAAEARAARATATPAGQGGIAVIPLKGVITPQPSLLSLLFGIDSGGLQGFRQNLRAAVADPNVSHIVLDVDSPGGTVDQVPETAQEILAARDQKPVVAVANTIAGSAAYWLASQAHEIVVTPSGEAGSIGVYQLHEDWSKAMEMEGIKPTLISAGKYKIEGNPYEPLNTDAFAAAKQGVDDYFALFAQAVAEGRSHPDSPVSADDVANGFGQGRMLTAKRAVSAGLADRVATLDQTVSRLQSGRAKVRRTAEADGEPIHVEAVERTAEDKRRLWKIREVFQTAGIRPPADAGAAAVPTD